MNYDDLKETLLENVCIVDFTKVNGENRLMKCTLKSDHIPETTTTPTTTGREFTPNPSVMVLAVWDLEANGWRSFRVENVNSIKIVE
jgi:hypothetical protein